MTPWGSEGAGGVWARRARYTPNPSHGARRMANLLFEKESSLPRGHFLLPWGRESECTKCDHTVSESDLFSASFKSQALHGTGVQKLISWGG